MLAFLFGGPQMLKAYLAGPDVFLPDARAFAARKIEICRRHGIEGLAPVSDATEWREIFGDCVAMMERSDLVIANLTPFRGASADAGTLVELGWFLGRGLPVFGYSNAAVDFSVRSRRQVEAVADPLPGLLVEGFEISDNLMIPGAVEASGCPIVVPAADVGFDSLIVFERCVRICAERLGSY